MIGFCLSVNHNDEIVLAHVLAFSINPILYSDIYTVKSLRNTQKLNDSRCRRSVQSLQEKRMIYHN